MIDYLEYNIDYLIWFNLLLLLLLSFLYRYQILNGIKKAKILFKTKNKRDIFFFVLKLCFLLIPFVIDWVFKIFIGPYVTKLLYICITIGFFCILILYLLFNLKNIYQKSTNFYKKKYGSLTFIDKLLIGILLILILFPIISDFFVKNNHEIYLKIYSKNVDSFFVDSTQNFLNASYDLEVKNNSNLTFDVRIITLGSSIYGELISFNVNDTDFNKPCCIKVPSFATVYPNDKVVINIFNKKISIPNLYNSPINLNSSRIVFDQQLFDICSTKNSINSFGVAFDLGRIAEYDLKDFEMGSHVLEFPFYWGSYILFSNKNEIVYKYYIFGHISHKPIVAFKNENAFATSGVFSELIGINNTYEYYGVNKNMIDKMFSGEFRPIPNNKFGSMYELFDWSVHSSQRTDNYVFNQFDYSELFYNNSYIFKNNPDFSKYIENQYSKFVLDTTNYIQYENRTNFNWKK